MVIDLGIDVTEHVWHKKGDIWTSQPGLLAGHGQKPRIAGQTAGLLSTTSPLPFLGTSKLKNTTPTVNPDATFLRTSCNLARWGMQKTTPFISGGPRGVPKNKQVILPPKAGTNCVSIACSHIIVKNITAIHAGNDGFNIHGDRRDPSENIRSLSNADEGISAHETSEMEVVGRKLPGTDQQQVVWRTSMMPSLPTKIVLSTTMLGRFISVGSPIGSRIRGS